MYKRHKIVQINYQEFSDLKYQQLYILSEDKIEVNDYYFKWLSEQCIHKCLTQKEADEVNSERKTDMTYDGKKIIASSDGLLPLPLIPYEFIKLYCEKDDISEGEVLIKYTPSLWLNLNDELQTFYEEGCIPQGKLKIRVAGDNTITIKSIENKVEELNLKLKTMKEESFVGWSEDAKNGYLTAVITIEEWIKKNF